MNRASEIEIAVGGFAFMGTLISAVYHPDGVIQMIQAINWEVNYREDWELLASRFTD